MRDFIEQERERIRLLEAARSQLDRIRGANRFEEEARKQIDDARRFRELATGLPGFPPVSPFENLLRSQMDLFLAAKAAFQSSFGTVLDAINGPNRFIQSVASQAAEFALAANELFEPFSQFRLEILSVVEDLQKFWSEEEKEVYSFLEERGWLGLEDYLTVAEFRDVLHLGRSGNLEGIDRFICQLFHNDDHRSLDSMITTWWSVEYLANRRQIVDDAVAAHKQMKYTLSVPALLPLVEGLAREIVKHPASNHGVVKIAARNYHESEQEIWSEVAVRVISTTMYSRYDDACSPGAIAQVNRHAILHGFSTTYASEASSLKMILLIDVFRRILSGSTLGSLTAPTSAN
ncbi:MAG TPA: hypothetical protein VES66_11620 [Terriglobales bacterium]|nr:hypothetical protein [Terriglobales bacterium]